MTDTSQNFGSPEVFTLVLGEERKQLYVARPILEQIKFFSNALKGDQFKEAKDKVFEMPDGDPKAVADVLHFVFADYVKPLKGTNKTAVTVEEIAAVEAYLRAYIVADKLMAELTANRLTDRLFEYHIRHATELELLEVLRDADLEESQLFEFLIDTFVDELKSAISEDKPFKSQRAGVTLDENDIFDNVTRDDAIDLLKRLTYRSEGGSVADNWRKCDLHTHEITPMCSTKA